MHDFAGMDMNPMALTWAAIMLRPAAKKGIFLPPRKKSFEDLVLFEKYLAMNTITNRYKPNAIKSRVVKPPVSGASILHVTMLSGVISLIELLP